MSFLGLDLGLNIKINLSPTERNPKSTRQNFQVTTNISPTWLQTSNKLPKNGSSNSPSLDTISLHKPAITTPPPKLPLFLLLLKPLRPPPLPSSYFRRSRLPLSVSSPPSIRLSLFSSRPLPCRPIRTASPSPGF